MTHEDQNSSILNTVMFKAAEDCDQFVPVQISKPIEAGASPPRTIPSRFSAGEQKLIHRVAWAKQPVGYPLDHGARLRLDSRGNGALQAYPILVTGDFRLHGFESPSQIINVNDRDIFWKAGLLKTEVEFVHHSSGSVLCGCGDRLKC
jgi:hypothetical protein